MLAKGGGHEKASGRLLSKATDAPGEQIVSC
jgi:hypothetical protein